MKFPPKIPSLVLMMASLSSSLFITVAKTLPWFCEVRSVMLETFNTDFDEKEEDLDTTKNGESSQKSHGATNHAEG